MKKQTKDTIEMNKADSQAAQNRFQKVIMVALFILALVQYDTMQQIKKNQATHLVPFIGDELIIGADYVNQEYLLNIVKNVNAFYSSATPSSARIQFSLLLSLISPTEYERVQKLLHKRESTLKSLKSTSIFSSPVWDKEFNNKELTKHNYKLLTKASDVYKVWQLKYRTNRVVLSNNQKPDVSTIYMTIDYIVKNGRFWILDIRESHK